MRTDPNETRFAAMSKRSLRTKDEEKSPGYKYHVHRLAACSCMAGGSRQAAGHEINIIMIMTMTVMGLTVFLSAINSYQ